MLNPIRVPLLVIAVFAVFAPLAGCHKPGPVIVKSPNLYIGSPENPYANVPEALRSNEIDVVYATDRQLETTKEGVKHYGNKRSRAVFFGITRVKFGEEQTWDQLATESASKKRNHEWPMKNTGFEQRGTIPALPPLVNIEGKWVEEPAYLAEQGEAVKALHAMLAEQLAKTPDKELFVFVHGYANTFESGSFRASQIWHFTGRRGVPVLYSWPAGWPGLLRGYNRDRESGEFTNPHLKAFLVALASCPDVKKIHLIAHSRGTDVMSNAVRELTIASKAAGRDPRSDLKLGQLILAAPDLDVDVTVERLSAERLAFVPEQLTMYVSPTDKAIGMSSWLFSSVKRLGQLGESDLDPLAQKTLHDHPTLSIVDCRVITDKRGHGYFLSSPAVLSDFILVLRDGKRPGAENGRPLTGPVNGMWQLRDDYLRPE